VEFTDYNPFGSIHANTRTASFREERKYIGEVYDEATGLNYLNARYYGGSRGVFLSQDPVFWEIAGSSELLQDPQQLNSYSYARNNPIVGSDPGGLLLALLPGTWSTRNSGDSIDSDFISEVQRSFHETRTTYIAHDKNGWSGGDNSRARADAAKSIADYINSYKFAPGEELNLVGHSHGGNVAILASQMIDHKIDNLVTYNTPVLDAYKPNMDKIAKHTQVFTRNDGVQYFGGNQATISGVIGQLLCGIICGAIGQYLDKGEFGHASRGFPGASNIDISYRTSWRHPIQAHSDAWNDGGFWKEKVDPLLDR